MHMAKADSLWSVGLFGGEGLRLAVQKPIKKLLYCHAQEAPRFIRALRAGGGKGIRPCGSIGVYAAVAAEAMVAA